jgi:DNA-binding response OmpR family regulator
MSGEARVLVVDDERGVRTLLGAYLARAGFAVVEAENGLDALATLRRGGIDVALVDVMLPGIDGLEVVRRTRLESTVPIVLLTARGEESMRVAGLEVGADDYVVKPFSAPEVVARVRAQLRRMRGFDEQGAILRVGAIELDRAARRCVAAGREVALTRREFDLLATLLRQPGRMHTRDQLLELVWGTTHVVPKTVDVHIASLRRKLGEAVSISTLRGLGYRLEV